MKLTILMAIITTGAFASSYDHAHVYAEALLEKFDQEISNPNFKLENSPSYKKLLATREFIESLGQNPNKENDVSVLEVTNAKAYVQTVNTIQNLADDRVIYPSTGSKGNITGNQFPAKTWSLTFDDGPRGQKTRTIVDKLYERDLKATFFMLTGEVKKYLSTAQYVLDAGMEIALHSYTHKSLARASEARLKYEITQAKIDLEKLLGVEIKNFRLPYGAGTRTALTRKYIAKNNLVHIFWNVDSLDWKDKDSQSVFRRVKRLMNASPKDAGVILFHDIQAPTVRTSEIVMDHLIEKNYNICTVNDVIKHSNGDTVSCIK